MSKDDVPDILNAFPNFLFNSDDKIEDINSGLNEIPNSIERVKDLVGKFNQLIASIEVSHEMQEQSISLADLVSQAKYHDYGVIDEGGLVDGDLVIASYLANELAKISKKRISSKIKDTLATDLDIKNRDEDLDEVKRESLQELVKLISEFKLTVAQEKNYLQRVLLITVYNSRDYLFDITFLPSNKIISSFSLKNDDYALATSTNVFNGKLVFNKHVLLLFVFLSRVGIDNVSLSFDNQ